MSLSQEIDEYEHMIYERVCKKLPFIKYIKMTDEEFCKKLDNDTHKGYTNHFYNKLNVNHCSRVCIEIVKFFYETGEYIKLGDLYIDGQNEYIIKRIMKAHDADDNIIEYVLRGKIKFQFKKNSRTFAPKIK